MNSSLIFGALDHFELFESYVCISNVHVFDIQTSKTWLEEIRGAATKKGVEWETTNLRELTLDCMKWSDIWKRSM